MNHADAAHPLIDFSRTFARRPAWLSFGFISRFDQGRVEVIERGRCPGGGCCPAAAADLRRGGAACGCPISMGALG